MNRLRSVTHVSHKAFGIYQMLYTQQKIRYFANRSLTKRLPHSKKIPIKSRKTQLVVLRTALVISTDKSLQLYFKILLKQILNFEQIEFAASKAEVLAKADQSLSWIIISEDFKDLSLERIFGLFHDCSKHMYIFIGNAEKNSIAQFGFDAVYKKSELTLDEIN